MDQSKSESAIIISSLAVGGIYAYRRLTESTTQKSAVPQKHSVKTTVGSVVGTGELLPVGQWVTGAGMSFIIISIGGAVSPNIGGYAAILFALSTFFVSGNSFVKDVKTHVKGEKMNEKTSENKAKSKG